MCQKATGTPFAVFVTSHDIEWTRGEPSRFRSSDLGERLFCSACGTPLAVDETHGGGGFEFATGAFDDPSLAPPTIQVHLEGRHCFFAGVSALPTPPDYDPARIAERDARLNSRQHPDHDTETWPPEKTT
jgi:hypothetical protein